MKIMNSLNSEVDIDPQVPNIENTNVKNIYSWKELQGPSRLQGEYFSSVHDVQSVSDMEVEKEEEKQLDEKKSKIQDLMNMGEVTSKDQVPSYDIILEDIPDVSTQDIDLLFSKGNVIDGDVKKNEETAPLVNIDA